MGIGRFATTPLLPLMVRDGLLAPGAGAWLAAGNYLGYLIGALVASRLRLPLSALMRASLAGIGVATAAMGLLDGLMAWIGLRFVAGVLSAWAMVAVSAWALQHLSQSGHTELAGLVYAGVGLGIASAGLFCLAAAQPGVPAGRLWLELGMLAALAVVVVGILVGRSPVASCQPPTVHTDVRAPGSRAGLVICYGALGFGYVLPATFLPDLARAVVDDPQTFGLAWPIFGVAAALSTIATGWKLAHANRLRVWAISHLLMAVGVVLPSLWLAPATIAIAALAVGGTFMVATMVGLQEARARAPRNPTALLAAMTAAFAIGQLAAPLMSGAIDLLQIGHHAALGHALQLAAVALAASALYLWHRSHAHSSSD
jgi:MFS family permease